MRDLLAKNANRTADPMVMIEILGVKRFSKVKTSCTATVFDERFYFEFPHLERFSLLDNSIHLPANSPKGLPLEFNFEIGLTLKQVC